MTTFQSTNQEKFAFNWLTTVGIAVIIGILISGVLSYTSDAPAQTRSLMYWTVYALFGACLLVGFLKWENYDNQNINFFALASLTAVGVTCMWMVRFNGLIWFLLMPLTMQAVIFLPRRQVILYTAGLVIGINSLAYWLVFDNLPLSLWLSNTVTIGGMYAVGIVIQIALIEQLRASAEVERLNAQLRDYALQSAELAAAHERNRMAHTIHDSIGHALTIVSVQLEAAERLIEHGKLDKATMAIQTARGVARDGLQEVRLSVQNLRSDKRDLDSKLSDALQTLLKSVANDALEVKIESPQPALDRLDTLSPSTQSILLSAVQEGLTNALKHASPSEITLEIVDRSPYVQLSLCNNNLKKSKASGNRSGIQTIRERIEPLGGRVEIHQTANTFELRIEVPDVR